MKKAYIIIAIVVVLAIVGAVWYNSKSNSLESAKATDPFDVDDTAAYNGARALIPVGDRAWMDPYVKSLYESKDPEVMVAGRASKTLAFITLAGRVNNNEKGTFTDKGGKKSLFPQETFDKMWTDYRNPFVAKYGGL